MTQSLHHAFAEIQTTKVAPGIHWLRLPLPFSMWSNSYMVFPLFLQLLIMLLYTGLRLSVIHQTAEALSGKCLKVRFEGKNLTIHVASLII